MLLIAAFCVGRRVAAAQRDSVKRFRRRVECVNSRLFTGALVKYGSYKTPPKRPHLTLSLMAARHSSRNPQIRIDTPRRWANKTTYAVKRLSINWTIKGTVFHLSITSLPNFRRSNLDEGFDLTEAPRQDYLLDRREARGRDASNCP